MPLTPLPCPPPRTLNCETDSIAVCEAGADEATVTSVPASLTSVTLLAANPDRRGAAIFNNSSSELYLKLGVGASSTSFTYRAATNAYFEVPFRYTGIITGAWSSATGNALITEVTD